MISKYKTLTIRDFKGLQDTFEDRDIEFQEAVRFENVRVNQVGSVDKRPSKIYYNTSSLGSNPIKFIYRFYYGGTNKELLMQYDTTLKKGDDTGGAPSNLKTGLTSTGRFQAVTYRDVCYLCNGEDTPMVYDGTNFENWGLASPGSSSMSAAEGDAGALGAGTYKYKVTYLYDGYAESEQNSDATSATIAASKKVDLSSIPIGSNGRVTARKLYRTSVGGSIFYYLDTISDNTTTTYTDNITDANLGTTIPPLDRTSPQTFKYIALCDERIFGVKKNSSRLYFSEINDDNSLPDSFPVTNYIDIEPDDGTIITGLEIDPSGILTIFKEIKIIKLYTQQGSPKMWIPTNPLTTDGTRSPYSIKKWGSGIIYIGEGAHNRIELRLFNGSDSKNIGEKKIYQTLQDINMTYISDVVLEVTGSKILIAYTSKEDGLTYNSRQLIYDFDRDVVSIDKNKNIASYCKFIGQDDDGGVYSGDSAIGRVYREETPVGAQDLIIETKTKFNNGTYSQTEIGGTEDQPKLYLDESELADDFGATGVDSLSSGVDSYTDSVEDTIVPGGTWISQVYYIGAENLAHLFWNEELGDYGDVLFYIRVGSNEANTLAAAWQGPYTDPTGSNISGVSANDYIQIKAHLFITETDQRDTLYLYQNDGYVIKITSGLGTQAESSINYVYQSGKIDFGKPDIFKRIKEIYIEHEGEDQTYYCYYSFDNRDERVATLTCSGKNTKFRLPADYCYGKVFQFRITEDSLLSFRLESVSINYAFQQKSY